MEDRVYGSILAGEALSSFITTDATQDVFELVLARSVHGSAGEHPRLVHLWWRAPDQGQRLVQVYVNDVLYDVTLDPTASEMFLVLDRSRALRIELLAVPAGDPEAIWRPQPALLKSWTPRVQSTANVCVERDEDLPVDTQIGLTIDGLAVEVGPMWSVADARCGAYDPSGPVYTDAFGLGFGVGALGVGPLGFDSTAWCWLSDELPTGTHTIQLHATDPSGAPTALSAQIMKTVDHLPAPVNDLHLSGTNTLAWD